MCAPASAWETRRFHQAFHRRVVQDALAVEQPAVAVRRVFAEADVGDDHQTGQLAHQRPDRALHEAILVPRRRSLIVLPLGQAEEQHAPDPVGRAAAASRTTSSTESWQTPGIDPTSRRTPVPSHTKSG